MDLTSDFTQGHEDKKQKGEKEIIIGKVVKIVTWFFFLWYLLLLLLLLSQTFVFLFFGSLYGLSTAQKTLKKQSQRCEQVQGKGWYG